MRIWWFKGASWETIHKSCFPSVWSPVSCGHCFILLDFLPDTFTSSLLIHVFDCWETLWGCAKLFGYTTKESQIWECRSRLICLSLFIYLSTSHDLWTKRKRSDCTLSLHTTPINHQCIWINHEPVTEVNNNGRHSSTSSHCPDLRLPYDVALPAQASPVISSQAGQSQNRKLQHECAHMSSCMCQSESCCMVRWFFTCTQRFITHLNNVITTWNNHNTF